MIPVAVIAVLAGWYSFRPERLVVNRRVDEAMPTAQGEVVSEASCFGTLLQHSAPDGGHRDHLPDGR